MIKIKRGGGEMLLGVGKNAKPNRIEQFGSIQFGFGFKPKFIVKFFITS